MPKLGTTAAVVDNIVKDANCLQKEFITHMAYQRHANINDGGITVTAGVVTDIVMEIGEVMKKVTASTDKIGITGQFTQDQGYYINSLTVDLTTIDKTSAAVICDTQNFCDYVFWILTSKNNEFFLGWDIVDGAIQQYFDQRQEDHSFSLGNDADSSSIVTWQFKQFCPIVPSSVGLANVPFV